MFEMQIRGFDTLQRQLDEVALALRELGGRICEIRLDPSDPTNVERAITDLERAVDERVERFRGNPWVQQISESVKEKYRQEILRRVEAARQAR